MHISYATPRQENAFRKKKNQSLHFVLQRSCQGRALGLLIWKKTLKLPKPAFCCSSLPGHRPFRARHVALRREPQGPALLPCARSAVPLALPLPLGPACRRRPHGRLQQLQKGTPPLAGTAQEQSRGASSLNARLHLRPPSFLSSPLQPTAPHGAIARLPAGSLQRSR